MSENKPNHPPDNRSWKCRLCSEGTNPSAELREEPVLHGPHLAKALVQQRKSTPERSFELRPAKLLKDPSLWSSNDDLFLNFVMASAAFFDQLGCYKELSTSY